MHVVSNQTTHWCLDFSLTYIKISCKKTFCGFPGYKPVPVLVIWFQNLQITIILSPQMDLLKLQNILRK